MPTYTIYKVSLGCLDITAPELHFETHKNLLKQKVNFEKIRTCNFFTNHKICLIHFLRLFEGLMVKYSQISSSSREFR